MGHAYIAVVAWGAIISASKFRSRFPTTFKQGLSPLYLPKNGKNTCTPPLYLPKYAQNTHAPPPEIQDEKMEELAENLNVEFHYDQQGEVQKILVCCENPILFDVRCESGNGRSFTDQDLQTANLESVTDFLALFDKVPERTVFVYEGA